MNFNFKLRKFKYNLALVILYSVLLVVMVAMAKDLQHIKQRLTYIQPGCIIPERTPMTEW